MSHPPAEGDEGGVIGNLAGNHRLPHLNEVPEPSVSPGGLGYDRPDVTADRQGPAARGPQAPSSLDLAGDVGHGREW